MRVSARDAFNQRRVSTATNRASATYLLRASGRTYSITLVFIATYRTSATFFRSCPPPQPTSYTVRHTCVWTSSCYTYAYQVPERLLSNQRSKDSAHTQRVHAPTQPAWHSPVQLRSSHRPRKHLLVLHPVISGVRPGVIMPFGAPRSSAPLATSAQHSRVPRQKMPPNSSTGTPPPPSRHGAPLSPASRASLRMNVNL